MHLYALLLSVALAADEVAPPQSGFQPVQLSMESERGTWGLVPGQPMWAQGVQVSYAGVRFAAQRLDYLMQLVEGATVVERADFVGGPEGRVLFDSSAGTLPHLAFRGVLRARAAAVRLQPQPAGGQLRWRIDLEETGDFHGVVLTAQGERQIVGWAQRMVIELASDVVRSSVVNPRLTTMHLYAQPESPHRLATALLMREPVPAAQAVAEPIEAAGSFGARIRGTVLTLTFDDLGQFALTGETMKFDGDQAMLNLGGQRSAPAILPAK